MGKLEVTGREILELKHALYYAKNCNHGTVGHNLLILVAKFAEYQGFRLNRTNEELEVPYDSVEIVQEPRR